MSQNSVILQSNDITSNQDVFVDPDMVEIYITQDQIQSIFQAAAILKKNDFFSITTNLKPGFELFESLPEGEEAEILVKDSEGESFTTFKAEYLVGDCRLSIRWDGSLIAEVEIDGGKLLKADFGLVDELAENHGISIPA